MKIVINNAVIIFGSKNLVAQYNIFKIIYSLRNKIIFV